MSDAWFNQGFGGDHLDKAEKESANKAPKRFWMKPDTSKKIIFLDDEPFCIWEHALQINGSWIGNDFTCRKGMQDDARCPFCNSNSRRTYVGFLTILDVDGWTNDKGKKFRNIRRLFPMKMKTLKQFKKLKERKKSIVGCMYEMTRSSSDAAVVGDMFDFLDKVDPFEDEQYFYKSKMDKGKKKPPEVYNYKEIFKPISAKEMLDVGQQMSSGGNYEDGGKGGSDEGKDGDAVY